MDWLQLVAAIPAGIGGVLLGQRLADWVHTLRATNKG